MFRHKKITAFIMGILICASAAAAPISGIYTINGHAEEETSAAEEETTGSAPEETATEAEDELIYGDFVYSVTIDDQICIEDYRGTEKDVVIPEEIDGKPVTEIGKDAFVTSVAEKIEIHAGIDYIAGENPFVDANRLKEINVSPDNAEYSSQDGILFSKDGKTLLHYPAARGESSYTIPEGVETIGVAALYDCGLNEIKLPSSLSTLKRHAMSYNDKLTSIDMSGTKIVTLDIMTFAGCTALTDVKFPENLIEIGNGAFAECTSLAEVELPENLSIVGQNAFAATAMEKVVIPQSVTDIGYCAFGYDAELKPISSFIIIGVQGSAAQYYAYDKDEEYDYENNFTFMTYDQYDSSIEFDEENLNYESFLYSVKDGEVYITSCTSGKTSISVPAEIDGMPVVAIYKGAFFQNIASSVILPDTLRTIDELAFYMCTSLKSITIPDGVTEIGANAFLDCSSLETVVIPGTCQTIGEDAFTGCHSLIDISVSNAEGGIYTSEDGILFTKDKATLVIYPSSKKGKSYTVPKETKEISASAFISNRNLESVELTSVVNIGNYAFEDCSHLKKVVFSENLEIIGDAAFYNCTSLKSVRLYDKITEIGAFALGYYYNEAAAEVTTNSSSTDTETETVSADAIVEDFKIYAPEKSVGHGYAHISGIECYTDTVEILGSNVRKGFLYAVLGAVGAFILGVIAFFTGKKLKKHKEEKKVSKLKDEAQKKLGISNNDNKKSDEKEESNED